jgi:excisionase family DNA binding protein
MTSEELPGLPDRLLTPLEVADYLGASERWLVDAVRNKQVRCTRIGKHVRFTREHVREIISSGEQPVLRSVGSARTRL